MVFVILSIRRERRLEVKGYQLLYEQVIMMGKLVKVRMVLLSNVSIDRSSGKRLDEES